MLRRLYIDNYLCLSNFEWRPGPRVLLAGRNGSGKSAVLDVLWRLHRLLAHQAEVEPLFPTHTLTAWDQREKQTLEFTIEDGDHQYEYQLVVSHDRRRGLPRIHTERLTDGGTLLYEFQENEAHLYWDDGTPGPAFPADSTRSNISTQPERQNNQRLIRFRKRVQRIYFFEPDPRSMGSHSHREERVPLPNLENIASWLRHLQAEDSTFSSRITEALTPLLPGFIGYGMTAGAGEDRSLVFKFKPSDNGKSEYKLYFEELSDGQRALVSLYIILNAVVAPDSTICFDEPDNFISLREIQPWLLELEDRQEETGCQCFFVSHHPEIIDHLTHMEETILLERYDGGTVRIRPFDWGASEGVNASELIARGWESDG